MRCRKPLKRSALKTNQTTAPASAAADPDSTMEPEEAEEEGHNGPKYRTSPKKPRRGCCHAQAFPLPSRPVGKEKQPQRRRTTTLPRHHSRPRVAERLQIRASDAGSYGPLLRGHWRSLHHSHDHRAVGRSTKARSQMPAKDPANPQWHDAKPQQQPTYPTLAYFYYGRTAPLPFSTGIAGERASVRPATDGRALWEL
jgi:hypothetical protein